MLYLARGNGRESLRYLPNASSAGDLFIPLRGGGGVFRYCNNAFATASVSIDSLGPRLPFNNRLNDFTPASALTLDCG